MKGEFILPPGGRWNPQFVNNKKEGILEVLNEDGVIIASLEYKNDLLNGACKFFRNGIILGDIPYCDDLANGWGYEYGEFDDKRKCLYENGEKKMELKKNEMKEGYYDEIDLKSGEILSICKINKKNEIHGERYVYKN